MSEVLLKIENLNKSFGITHANVNINFSLYKMPRRLAGHYYCCECCERCVIITISSGGGKMLYNFIFRETVDGFRFNFFAAFLRLPHEISASSISCFSNCSTAP